MNKPAKQALLFLMPIAFLFCHPMYLWGQRVEDKLAPASTVVIKGVIGERLNNAYENRILAQDVDRLVNVFKPENRTETRLWQSEFWGKWLTSAVLAYRYQQDPRLKKILDYAVSSLIKTQTPDGYIGNYAKEHLLQRWDVWGRKYVMLGLLDYYDLTSDKNSLQSAVKVADNLMDDLKKADGILVTKGNYKGMAASSVLEPIALLYERTKNKKYLQFAETIVAQWDLPEGPQLVKKSEVNVANRFPRSKSWYGPEQGQKAYEMMSCYEGLLELYRITGKTAYKKAVEDVWQNIKDTEINIAGSGASAEMWFGGKIAQTFPVYHYQETCVTVTWIKLSMQLLRLTGGAKYADAVETAYYNALLGAMSKDGATWAKYTPLTGQRLPGSEQCGMGLNCCEASGPRGLFAMPLQAVSRTADGLQVNYYVGGEYILQTPNKQQVQLKQETAYPAEDKISIHVKPARAEAFVVSVRIPEWSTVSFIRVNGKRVENTLVAGQFASVKREWKPGDLLEVDLDMRGRVVKMQTSPGYIAIVKGPIVLARDARLKDAPVGISLKPIIENGGFINLTVLNENHHDYLMEYTAKFLPESYKEGAPQPIDIKLCDYASAGYAANSPFFQVWIPQLIDPKNNSFQVY